ncbi:MAG: MBL fold metallo-hydrolase, partial [Thermofilaceae archaeon]
IVELGGVRIYHAGDTDLIPEMESLRGHVDVALVPVSGVYVMTAGEAVEAVRRIQPALAIPMHYGAIVGDRRDAESFKRLLEGVCEVAII